MSTDPAARDLFANLQEVQCEVAELQGVTAIVTALSATDDAIHQDAMLALSSALIRCHGNLSRLCELAFEHARAMGEQVAQRGETIDVLLRQKPESKLESLAAARRVLRVLAEDILRQTAPTDNAEASA